jgi:hypothetical protein
MKRRVVFGLLLALIIAADVVGVRFWQISRAYTDQFYRERHGAKLADVWPDWADAA